MPLEKPAKVHLPELREKDLDPNPFKQFEAWLKLAVAARLYEPYAMSLATASKDGEPSARMILLRGFDERGFVFFTNYESLKGRDLEENPRAALVMYWADLERQIRVSGDVERVTPTESDAYFRTRTVGSQLSAWVSKQSEVIASRAALEGAFAEAEVRFAGNPVPLPPYWGGYRVAPRTVEFWQGRPSRLHDRLRYTKQPDGTWKIDRLAP